MNKYRNKKPIVDGIKFDSKKEAKRYVELKRQQEIGLITDLKLQQKYTLIAAQYEASDDVYIKGVRKGEKKPGKLLERECSYYADFDYYRNGEHIVEDAKGMKLPEYIIKRKLMLFVHGIKIKEV